MKYFIGLDVSVKETAVCIVDESGKICREVKVHSHPDDLLAIMKNPTWKIERVGLEAGPLSQWLFEALASAGLPVICIETRHAKAFLRAQPNKTDRNDARGIAQMMRVNLYRPVHVKTLTSQRRLSSRLTGFNTYGPSSCASTSCTPMTGYMIGPRKRPWWQSSTCGGAAPFLRLSRRPIAHARPMRSCRRCACWRKPIARSSLSYMASSALRVPSPQTLRLWTLAYRPPPATLRGRPPLRPFSRAAAVLARDRA